MPKPVIDYSKVKTDEDKQKLKDLVDVCPVDVFAFENNKLVVKNPDACIGCRACEASAPEGSIKVVD